MEDRLEKIKAIIAERDKCLKDDGFYPEHDIHDDGHIDWLVEEVERLHEKNRELKSKSWYLVYEENLRLSNELAMLKAGAPV